LNSHQTIDEEVDGGVDDHEEEGDRSHDHHPEGQEVAGGLVISVATERVDTEELVEVEEDSRKKRMK
jgi:hypothetical protein